MNKTVNRLMSDKGIQAVLVDIGASGAPPSIWQLIAPNSIYIGFDPDARDFGELPNSPFQKTVVVNKAVTSHTQKGETSFYFTKSPYCSSTLKPNTESLSNYFFSNLFTIQKEGKVSVLPLNSVIDDLALPQIDWFKTDSQGTDLRIFYSLREEFRSRILAVDIEPGLIDAYLGEDLFVDAHKNLIQNGFWLSNMNVLGSVRMKRSTFEQIASQDKNFNENLVIKGIKTSPGWCEARYLRTIDWLADGQFGKRDYILLWIFALLDGQYGFAIDVGFEYEKCFGKDKTAQLLQTEPIAFIKRTRIKSFPQQIIHRLIKITRKLNIVPVG